jgi:AcrR family transcriptional regulator
MAEAPAEVDDVAEKLLSGSLDLIRAEGCSSLGVRRLAQAANRSSMCVYSHFGSRGDLLTAAYGTASASLLDALDGKPEEGYIAWAQREPQLYSLLFDHPLDALDIDPGRRRELVEALIDRLSVETWARLHGEVSHARILAARTPQGTATE